MCNHMQAMNMACQSPSTKPHQMHASSATCMSKERPPWAGKQVDKSRASAKDAVRCVFGMQASLWTQVQEQLGANQYCGACIVPLLHCRFLKWVS